MQEPGDVSSKIQVQDIAGFKYFFFNRVRISYWPHLPAEIGI